MKFKEPLEIICPACDSTLQASLASILNSEPICPNCGTSLSAIRESIEKTQDEVRLVCNCIAIASEIEKQFKVEFVDEDIANVHTVSDLIEVTLRILHRSGQDINQNVVKDVIIRIITSLSENPPELIKPETRILDFGNLRLFS
jgi:hypothetical protein